MSQTKNLEPGNYHLNHCLACMGVKMPMAFFMVLGIPDLVHTYIEAMETAGDNLHVRDWAHTLATSLLTILD